jgi:hypothetical protein
MTRQRTARGWASRQRRANLSIFVCVVARAGLVLMAAPPQGLTPQGVRDRLHADELAYRKLSLSTIMLWSYSRRTHLGPIWDHTWYAFLRDMHGREPRHTACSASDAHR